MATKRRSMSATSLAQDLHVGTEVLHVRFDPAQIAEHLSQAVDGFQHVRRPAARLRVNKYTGTATITPTITVASAPFANHVMSVTFIRCRYNQHPAQKGLSVRLLMSLTAVYG